MIWAYFLSSTVAFAQDGGGEPANGATGEDPVEWIEVSAVRAPPQAAAAVSELSADEIAAASVGQELPYVLQATPGVQAWGDNGTGFGYSYLSLRGFHQTRLNLTLNGVPLADAEDMGVYLSNLADFAGSVGSVQVQRGVGVSAGGTPSFAGGVHYESLAPARHRGAEITVGGGSFGTGRASVSLNTGEVGRWRGVARASALASDGFRDHSAFAHGAFYGAAERTGDQDTLRIVAIGGRERTELAFYAVEDYLLADEPRYNPLGDGSDDAFGQEVVQVQYARDLGDDDQITGSVYWNGARGTYSVHEAYWDPSTPMHTYALDSGMIGAFTSAVVRADAWTVTPGVHLSGFQRWHARDVDGVEAYRNRGQKAEGSAFVRARGDWGAWHPSADLQARVARFAYQGDVAIAPITWSFLNPKLGLRISTRDTFGVYGSVGLSGREPTRSDLFLGEDDPTVAYDLHQVEPERVLDLELGATGRTDRWSWSAGAYAMELRHEIAMTGELTDTGLYLRRNVDRSFRRGVEGEIVARPVDAIEVRAAGSLGWNRIAEWTQGIDLFDADFNWAGSATRTYEDVPVLLSPWGMATLSVAASPIEALGLRVGARAVSDQALDNTGPDALRLPGYLLLDGDVTLRVERWVRLPEAEIALRVDNALSETAWPSGYSWRYATVTDPSEAASAPLEGITYAYPQAPRAVMAEVRVGF